MKPSTASCDNDFPLSLDEASAFIVKRSPQQGMPPVGEGRSAPRRKTIPHSFVLEAIADRSPATRAMFGALAVYVGDKIVFILRDRADDRAANGVWLAVSPEHEASLRADFPDAGQVRIMKKAIKGWLLLSSDSADFEKSSVRACELALRKDPRVGKVTARKR